MFCVSGLICLMTENSEAEAAHLLPATVYCYWVVLGVNDPLIVFTVISFNILTFLVDFLE